MMFSNCSGAVKRPSADTGAVNSWSAGAGCSPIAPDANWTFWLRTCSRTSSGAIENARGEQVIQRLRAEGVVLGADADGEQKAGISLRDRDALLNYFRRQARLGERRTVLSLHGRDVGIRSRLEGERD